MVVRYTYSTDLRRNHYCVLVISLLHHKWFCKVLNRERMQRWSADCCGPWQVTYTESCLKPAALHEGRKKNKAKLFLLFCPQTAKCLSAPQHASIATDGQVVCCFDSYSLGPPVINLQYLPVLLSHGLAGSSLPPWFCVFWTDAIQNRPSLWVRVETRCHNCYSVENKDCMLLSSYNSEKILRYNIL